jgi:hypothetical protein
LENQKTGTELLQERIKRIEDATQIKVPDRIPISASFSYLPAKYNGLTCEDAFYNTEKWLEACKKTIVDFAPDICTVETPIAGSVLELLGSKQVLVPGHGTSAYHSHQFVEDEYMKTGEYDDFLKDPSDYVIRYYLPRIYSKLGALSNLPRLSRWYFGWPEIWMISYFGKPEFVEAMEAVTRASKEAMKWLELMGRYSTEIEALGFPSYCGTVTLAPYDLLPDLLRGMKASMLDLYRRPDKVLEACEKVLLPIMVEKALMDAQDKKNKRVFIPLHRGAEGFMSLKQFETFYWPTLKKLLVTLVEAGLTPVPFFEGDYTSRLEYLTELPKGKIIAHLDTTDLAKAKQIIGKTICIQGNMPASILQTGTPEEVQDYTRKLIDIAGKDGGYIMSSRGSLDEANPELVKVWIDCTKEYGVYR